MKNSQVKIASAVLLASLVTACGKEEGFTEEDLYDRPQVADLQFINLIADSPNLDVTLDSLSLALPYGQASQLTGLLIGDEYELDVSYVDVNGDDVHLIADDNIEYIDEDQFVYLITGSLTAPLVQSQRFVDPQYSDEIPAGQIEFWFSYTGNSEQEVDVYLTGFNTAIQAALPDATLTTSAISAVLGMSSTDILRLRVTPRNSYEVLFDSGPFTVVSQSRVMFAITDYFGPKVNGNELNALLVDVSGATLFPERDLPSAIRVIDLVRDVPALDVYLGGPTTEPLAANLPLLGVSDYVTLEDDDIGISLNLTEVGVKDKFLLQKELGIVPGQFYSLIVTGSVAEETVDALLVAANPRPIHERVSVSFINAADSNDFVNVHFLLPGQTTGDISAQIGLASNLSLQQVVIPSGLLDVVITSGDGNNVIYGPERINFDDTASYTMVLVDDLIDETSATKLFLLKD